MTTSKLLVITLIAITSMVLISCGGGGNSEPEESTEEATAVDSTPSPTAKQRLFPTIPTGYYNQSASGTKTPEPTASSETATNSSEKQMTSQGTGREVLVDMLDLSGGSDSYAYTPADFNFKLGDTITFNLTTQGEFHTFTIDDLKINVSVDAESSEIFTYTFDKLGTFELICIPHQFLGMVGTIKVQ